MPENRDIVPYKDPDLVILRNPVAKAKFGLSVVQTKILFEVITFFKNNPEKKLMRFYVRDYLQSLGYETHNIKAYTDEIEAMTQLHLQIPEGENKRGINYLAVNLFAGARFRIDERGFGYVDIEVSEMLKPYFLEIAQGDFFYYHIVNTRVLKSTHSIKLYLLLKSYKRFKTLEISLTELRTILEIPTDEYPRYTDFKKRILERAKQELQEKNDIYFTYSEVRARPNNSKSEVLKIQFFIHDNPDRPDIKEKVRQLERQAAKKQPKAPTLPTEIVSPELPFYDTSTLTDALYLAQNDIVLSSANEPFSLYNAPLANEKTVKTNDLKEAIDLFRGFDAEATEAEITDFIESLQRETLSILDVLNYAQQEKAKGTTIKNIYAYLVSGLKSSFGKGLTEKLRKKKEKETRDKQAQEDHKKVILWFDNEFRTTEMQHYYDLGTDADVPAKQAFLERKRQEAEENPSVKKRFFEASGVLKQDELRFALGLELSQARGESRDSLFTKWAMEKKGVRLEKQGDKWLIAEILLF
jgi:Initiator Replication protein